MDYLKMIGNGVSKYETRAKTFVREIKSKIIVKSIPASDVLIKKVDYKTGSQMPNISDGFLPFNKGEKWGTAKDEHCWFYSKINIEKIEGKRCELLVSTGLNGWDARNPQFILYIDGKIVQGMDTNHTTALITEYGEKEVYLYAYTGTNAVPDENGFVESFEPLALNLNVIYIDEDVERLYYNMQVLTDVLEYTDINSLEYAKITTALNDTINCLDMRDAKSAEFIKSVKKANEYIETEFYGKVCSKDSDKKVAMIGHTHIDIAWLWTVQQTVEKAQRSFATVIALMDRYPHYRFTSSQVVLYKAVKEENPELYEKIKQRIKEGRWEVEGGMYVEADCNLTSGEGFVRQFLYGKKFFKNEFGVDSKVLWLPDVFGYSAALPQIMQKCGVTDFVTSKISWNDTNMMPYDIFNWKGIDGTSVTTHFITTQHQKEGLHRHTTYVGEAWAGYIAGSFNRNQQKFVHTEGLSTIGYGDGGGGSTPYDCEVALRLEKGIPNTPIAKFKTFAEYLKGIEEDKKKSKKDLTPTWSGELYLEYHRGTYTSQGHTKKNNRKCEFAMQNAETVSVLANALTNEKFDKEKYDACWEKVLINQFHDILPGSSIKEVYEVTEKEHAEVLDFTSNDISKKLSLIADNNKEQGLLVYNPNSYEFNGVVDFDGERYCVNGIKSKGYKVVSPKKATNNVVAEKDKLENDNLKILFDTNFDIVSVYDKRANREVIKDGKKIRLIAYQDFNYEYDNWELSSFYTETSYELTDIIKTEILTENDRKGLRVVKKFGNSIIDEKIYLGDNSDQIDFEVKADWNSDHIILKKEFPLDIVSDKATCEIQFGATERNTHSNTSWDWAQFEVCAHKYVDVSESDYGVAILNDSKYGYGIKNNDVSLSLLRGPKYPDPSCDIREHEFKYSMYVHNSSYTDSETVKRAYELNNPCIAVKASGKGNIASEYSLVSTKNEKLVIDTVKVSEDEKDVVVRLYEPYRRRGTETLSFGFDVKKVTVSDMLENELYELEVNNNTVEIPFKPFEIITIKVQK